MSGGVSTTTAIAIGGLAVSAIGAGVGAMGAIQSANAQKASADYQAQVAANNQKTAQQNAAFAAASGEAQAANKAQQTRAQVGAVEAQQGSFGVDINSPTASAVRTSQGELGALDADTIRSNAARQAYGYEGQANNFGNAEQADIAQGNNAATAGDFNAGSGLLSGFGNAGLNYAGALNKASGLDGGGEIYGPPAYLAGK
jgi:hypothetical protein